MFPRHTGRFMDFLTQDEKDKAEEAKLYNELRVAYAVIEMQTQQLRDMKEKLNHLEELLLHKAKIIETDKE